MSNPRYTPCQCDVCTFIVGPGDAVTPEGFCGFCARHCFPWGAVPGGEEGRVVMSLEARSELHRLEASYGTVEPEQVNKRAAVRFGISAMEAAAPLLSPKVRAVINVLAKKAR